ncbi:MAG: saccharopine dehydrogenase NADP-binding domain-containing protein [Geodermatophilaceae bacterium]|nr:saccharopine dehydrogenase NADP-binding domain-containing protein [Geodermatophilaceae bacterium]
MTARIVLFGATGFTGELTARALVARGRTPVLAGRSPERLATLARTLGNLETAIADVARPDSVRALVGTGDVLISTVGPFVRYGDAAVRAAVDAGAHYLDSTGEAPFIRTVFERHGPAAERAGCALLTAFGYDWVPGNLAGALALRDAGPDARRVDIGYFLGGPVGSGSASGGPRASAASGGTRASAAGMLLEPAFAWRGHRLVTEPSGRRVRTFEVDGQSLPALSVGGSEHFALPRHHPELAEVGVHLGWFGTATRAVQGASYALSTAARLPGVRRGLQIAAGRLVPGSTGGPDAASRATTRSTILAVTTAAGGSRLATARLEGSNGYDFTANVLAWAAERAAGGGLRGCGALGPVDGFGLDELERGAAEAGLSRV